MLPLKFNAIDILVFYEYRIAAAGRKRIVKNKAFVREERKRREKTFKDDLICAILNGSEESARQIVNLSV